MIKKLTKHGNSLALVIDRPILDLLGIDADTPLQITTDGTGLRIVPAIEEVLDEDLTAGLHDLYRRYGNALKRLAE